MALKRTVLLGKLGLTFASVDADATLNGAPAGSASEDSTEPMFGVGIEINEFIRVEFERHTDVGGPDTGESDIDVLGVSALYRF
jgi:hypothetical protein